MKALFSYFREVKNEFAKVVFPTRQELVRYTIVVVAAISVAVVAIGAVDFGLAQLVKIAFVK